MSSYTIAAFFSVGYPGGYVPFRSGMVVTKKTIITELEGVGRVRGVGKESIVKGLEGRIGRLR